MAMKLGRSAMEELDLDSFLNSVVIDDNDSDVENDLHTSLHRTVDDILNDYELSSLSSSPPSFLPCNNSHLPHSHISSDFLVSEVKFGSFSVRSEFEPEIISDSLVGETLKSDNEGDFSALHSASGFFSRAGSVESYSGGSFSAGGKTNQPLPPLFRSFRSNVNKPGDALAAAAAASRSITTPHATAIKSSRACHGTVLSSSALSDDSEYVFEVSPHGEIFMSLDAVSNANNSLTALTNDDQVFEENKQKETCSSEENINGQTFESINIEEVNEVKKSGNLIGLEDMQRVTIPEGINIVSEKQMPTCVLELEGNKTDIVPGKQMPTCVHELKENKTRVNEFKILLPSLDVESKMDSSTNFGTYFAKSEDSSSTPGNMEVENKNTKSSSPVEHSFMVDKISSSFESDDFLNRDLLPFHSSLNERKSEEDLETTALGIEESSKVMLLSNDGEANLPGVESIPERDVSGIVEDLLVHTENKMDIRRGGKKLDATAKPLELAEEFEKKLASTGLHWEEGAAAQPMRLEGVRRGSTVLGYFKTSLDNTVTRIISSQAFKRDHGSLQCVAVHPIFIAVGMSKGLIIVVPSRYSADNADNMDGKILMLGSQWDQSHPSITSICFNYQGDLLLAGYADGHATVWDVQRGAAAKVITGEHTTPVVHAFFLGQDSRQFVAVTGDSKGLILFHEFSSSKVPMINRFSLTTKCIIDGQRGKVLSASPLLLGELSGGGLMSSQSSMLGCIAGDDAGWKFFNGSSSFVEEGVAIFVTYQTALVIRVTPTPKLYAQLSRPDGVREGSMPYVAWKCAVQSHNSSSALEKVSLLAIAWDRKVLVTMMVKSEMKICAKWTLESTATGVVWLDEQMLVILTLTGQLCLFDKDGSFIHKTSFSVDGSVTDDLIMYHTQFTNMFGNPEKSFHNSVAARGGSIYIIGPSHLIVSRLLPWKERILVLRKAGDWMGALNMAITIYDGEAHDVIDLPRSVDAVHEVITPYLVELLLSYVDEVFSYISVAFHNQLENIEQINDSKNGGKTVHFQMNEQYTCVGGVAVEFCEHIKKTDILFDEIYSKFVAVQQRDTFLELLEPYILKDMLGFLPPEIMQALVEHYSSKGWLQRIEQCVLHMDISSLDFNQVVKLCREHGLYGALVYLFNRGLDDFRAPLEELLTVLQNSNRESAAPLGYKMLVYLKYCFTGLAFPPGHGTLPHKRLPSLRNDLVQFLLEETNSQSIQLSSYLLSTLGSKNLYHLLELDTEATLYVLSFAFDDDKGSMAFHDSSETVEDDVLESDLIYKSNNFLIQKTVDVLAYILDKAIPPNEMPSDSYEIASIETWPSKKDLGHVFDFIAYYIACEKVHVSKSLLGKVFEYLTTVSNIFPSLSNQDIEISKIRENQMLSLLEVLPQADWDESYVLHLSEKARFYQVCGLINTFRQQYLAALDSYMKDINEPIHTFSFIHNTLLQLVNSMSATFRTAIISRIPELVNLSREDTLFMVINHFNNEIPLILMELRSHPKSLFLYLKTVIEVYFSGTLKFPCLRNISITDIPGGIRMKNHSNRIGAYLETVNDFSKILRNNPISVNDDIIELYLQLLCQYEQKSVLKFLQTFENYRVEHCLRLCQEYRIIDAAAFLLERVGDVGSALLLSLSDLNDKFIMLDAALKGISSDIVLKDLPSKDQFCSILRIKEVSEIHDILRSCIGLCQRNSPRLDLEESKFLWFRLLDSFCIPFIDIHDKVLSEGESCDGMLSHLNLNKQVDRNVCDIKWTISKSDRWAPVLKKLFSMFIKMTIEGMMGHVPLPTVMSKLLSDNSCQEFGDFKLTIMEMLSTYVFEKRILHTAKSLIEDDAFYTMRLLKKGASHGYAPRILTCCICNCVLVAAIRVFSCGHSTHLRCEPQEHDGSYAGCPVCMPMRKTSHKSRRHRSASPRNNNGLVNKSASRSPKPQATNVLMPPFESNAQDNPYGLRLNSRFEILSDLRKEQRSIRIENAPRLRLAPPAIYHEKVKIVSGGGDSGASVTRSPKAKGSSSMMMRFSPLKRSFLGKEKGKLQQR